MALTNNTDQDLQLFIETETHTHRVTTIKLNHNTNMLRSFISNPNSYQEPSINLKQNDYIFIGLL